MSKYDLFLDGRNIKEFGLFLRPNHEHPIPETRDQTIEIPGIHGLRHMGSTLGPRQFNLPLGIVPQIDRWELQRKIREFTRFLLDDYGRPRNMRLIFGYEPDKYYMVRYNGSISPERLVTIGVFELPLIAYDPHAYFLYSTTNIILDSDIPVLSDITLGAQYEFDINPTPTQSVVCDVINDGTVAVRPTILITGEADYITFWNTRTEEIFFINDVRKPIEINGENYTVKVDGVENFSVLNGEFITLLPGENNIVIGAGGNRNLKAAFDFNFKYI